MSRRKWAVVEDSKGLEPGMVKSVATFSREVLECVWGRDRDEDEGCV